MQIKVRDIPRLKEKQTNAEKVVLQLAGLSGSIDTAISYAKDGLKHESDEERKDEWVIIIELLVQANRRLKHAAEYNFRLRPMVA